MAATNAKVAIEVGAINGEQLTNLFDLQLEQMKVSLPHPTLTLQDVVRQRGKIVAQPPEKQAKIANLAFDAFVDPPLDTTRSIIFEPRLGNLWVTGGLSAEVD